MTSTITLFIGYTTVSKISDADKLARLLLDKGAICVQIDGPIKSYYYWENRLEVAEEYRLTVKFLEVHLKTVTQCVHTAHPYTVPQWIVIKSYYVGESYGKYCVGDRADL